MKLARPQGSWLVLGEAGTYTGIEASPCRPVLREAGPYSRKLYGPVTPKSSMIDRSRERQSQKTLSQSKLVGGLNKLRREKLVYTPADNFREKVFDV